MTVTGWRTLISSRNQRARSSLDDHEMVYRIYRAVEQPALPGAELWIAFWQ